MSFLIVYTIPKGAKGSDGLHKCIIWRVQKIEENMDLINLFGYIVYL